MRVIPLNAPDRELLERVQAAGRISLHELTHEEGKRANRLSVRGLLLRTWRGCFAYESSRNGLAALADFGRVEKAGRIYCLNPKCGRTGDATKSDELVCAVCWKLLPKEVRDDYRDLHALEKKLARRRAKRGDGVVEVPLSAIGLSRRISANWDRIRDFFLSPEKPEGLETFLEEMGWTSAPSPS